jgi:hypothetical protein
MLGGTKVCWPVLRISTRLSPAGFLNAVGAEQTAHGWKTHVMVQRYSHLSPDHIKAAVERLARTNSDSATGTKTGTGAQT